jgi:pimeloyl-ACP methyl ester carboxylesterase
MRSWILASLAFAVLGAPGVAKACEVGLYQSPDRREYVAISKPADGANRYLFVDGRRGRLTDRESPVHCVGDKLKSADNIDWQQVPLQTHESRFRSHGELLNGALIENPIRAGGPLVVMVHGSERTSPRTSAYPYILASLGLDVFIYDKRGTGQSEGEYTQNFELLADDAGAALKEARRLAVGRFSRTGYYGGSQGGWIAPLAATRSPADFVVVGFGLMASPLEEDLDQVLSELREKGFGEPDLIRAREVAEAAGRLVATHFATGFEEVATVRRRYSSKPWFAETKGEFTGAIMQTSDADLRRVGRALFDNVELIWDYDAEAVLRQVKVPQLWILAEADREAPPETSLQRLQQLRDQGSLLTIYSFPNTDHGMYEFVEAADGSRAYTRITEGYFQLVGDWIEGKTDGTYGRARKR